MDINTDQSAHWPRPANVSVVVDTPGWFDPFAESLARQLNELGHSAAVIRKYEDVPAGDIAFYLSCMKITPSEVLARHQWNFVVHASALPEGRGFSPLVWQILEGRSEIPITMIAMSEGVDEGDIARQSSLHFEGHELNTELRDCLGQAIVEQCLSVVSDDQAPSLVPQEGSGSWYRRRRPEDSRVDPNRPIAEQFDLLRVVDNERYPAFFDHRGHRYKLLIEDTGPIPEE